MTIESGPTRCSTLVCLRAGFFPHDELCTQVKLGPKHGLKHESSIHCDELVSVPKEILSYYVGRLDSTSMQRLDHALAIALHLEEMQ